MIFNGNIGARYVITETNATGFMTLAHTAVTAAYNPITNPGAVVTTTVALNTSLENDTTDWLPAYNLNLWVMPDELVLRYYQGEVMSRPPPGALLPSGTCTIDERNNADVNGTTDNPNTCSGRVGNPGLQPFQAINRNLSLEWYPTEDLMLSVAHYRNKIDTGAPINANMPASNLFAGNDAAVDPVTGQPFSDFDFTYPSYVNGPSGTQLGMEYTAKVAFTFLPWIFRHTGVDAELFRIGLRGFRDIAGSDNRRLQSAARSALILQEFRAVVRRRQVQCARGLPGPIRVLRLHLVLLERHQQLPDVVRAMPGPDDPYALQSRRHELSRGHGISSI